MPKYKLSPLAEEDLLHIFESTIESWGILQAREYALLIESALEKLTEYPEIGIQRDELYKNTRSFLAEKHIIYFRSKNDVIEIARILHQKMDHTKYL